MDAPFTRVTNLGRRLTLLVIGFSSLIAVFTTGFELYYDYRKTLGELELMLEKPPLSYESIAKSLWDFDAPQITLAIEALARLPNVAYVEVTASGPSTHTWNTGSKAFNKSIERHFPLTISARGPAETLGSLTIIATLDGIHQNLLSRALLILAGNFLKTILVAAFMLLLFRRMITERLNNLATHIKKKSSPLLNSPLLLSPTGPEASDEIDTLQRTFDQLCARITDQNASLTETVTQRTDALTLSENNFRTLVDHTPLGIALINSDGRAALFNPAFTRLLGYSMDNASDPERWWQSAFPDPVARENAIRTWREIATAPAEAAIDRVHTVKVRRADGVDRRIEFTIVALPQRRQLVSIMDVTERQKAERALQVSELRFRSFVENANDVLFALTETGVFTYVSPQWELDFGYTMEETIGQPFAPFVHPDDIAGCIEFLELVMRTGEKQSGVEYRVRRKLGDYVWYRANASRVNDPVSSAPVLVGIGRDISQLKRSREALAFAKKEAEHANQAKTRFLAAASHDLRQPATAIALFADSLRNTALTEEQEKLTGYLTQAAANMRDLLETLLDVSTLDSGRLSPRVRLLPVLDLMTKIEAGFSPAAQAKSLRFKLFFPQHEAVLFSDEKLLNQLLSNLVGNALKYTERGGILVGVRRRGDHAVFQVWDTGRGIALEHIGDIFDEYFQVDNPERDAGKGLGLGLAIAMRLARLLGSEISCRSRPGRGSMFEFSMPLVHSRRSRTSSSASDTPTA